MAGFFEGRVQAIDGYLRHLPDPQSLDASFAKKVIAVGHVLADMSENYEIYDRCATYLVGLIGGAFSGALAREDFSETGVERMLIISTRFVREATLNGALVPEATLSAMNLILRPNNESADAWSQETDYLVSVLPITLVNAAISGVEKARRSAEEVVDRMRREVDDIEVRITRHKVALEGLAQNYNFASLSNAFSDLAAKRRGDKRWALSGVVILGFIVLLPFFSYLVIDGDYPLLKAVNGGWSPAAVVPLILVVGFEVVALYFFRVVLRSFLLAKAQLINLQMRVSLCAFIEEYVNFAKSKGGGESLKSFEAFVFAQIPTDGESLPATFEGLEQIASIIRASKS